tara:strand:+ start:143 stop:376 length:234 start_codon:yes stop_codon:yes gene_type:complete
VAIGVLLEKDQKVAICKSLLLKPDGDVDFSGDFIDRMCIVYNSKTKIDQIKEISSARGHVPLVYKKSKLLVMRNNKL